MTKDDALKLALEALEQLQGCCTDHDDGTVEAITVWCPEVIDAIKEALAQPAPRLWVGLTDEERNAIEAATLDLHGIPKFFATAIEAKLKEKNT
jgi:hypothetical protein